MAFCANCGAETTGAFCPNCGAAMGSTGAGQPGGGTGPGAGAPVAGGLTENTASALCYLFGLVTGIVFLLIAPYNQNKTIRFNAFQAIFLHVAVIVCFIGMGFLGFITHGLSIVLYPLLSLGAFLLWLYMMWSAYNNKKVVLPIVGPLAQAQA
jgi:uncharacterized membrane protein